MFQFPIFTFIIIIFIQFFIAGCHSDIENIGRGEIGEVENQVIFPDCLKSPESVPIECHLVNVKSWECIQDNVLSTPNIDNEDLGEIKCTSSLPVDLSFEGYQLNDFIHPSFVRHTENVFVNDTTFTYSVSFPLADLKVSRKVVVSQFDNPKQKMAFFLFRPGTSIFSSNYKPDPGSSLNQTSPLVLKHTGKYLTIPCIPNDPNITVTLEVPAVVEHLKPVYDNMKGFTIQTDVIINPSGRYVCKAEERGQLETVMFDVHPKSGSIYEPPNEKIFLFHSNSELYVSCKSNQDVMVAGWFQGTNIINRENGTWSKIESSTSYPPFTGQYIEKLHEAQVGASGRIECKASWSGFVLKTWDIEVLDIYNNSVLQINKISEKKIACQSDTFPIEDIKLQLIFCQGETGCKLNEFCFNDKEVNSAQLNMSACPKTMQYSAPCSIPESRSSSSSTNSVCLEVPHDDLDGLYSQGMIRCTAGPHSYQTSFFIGFDGILYFDWKQAPTSALVTILTPKEPLYAQTSYPFGCKAAKFLSDGRLQWVLREENGSDTILHNLENRIQDMPGFYATNRDYQLYTVRESNIRLVYPNMSDLICMVPQWNGAGWTSFHKRINVTVRPVDLIDPTSPNTTTVIAVSASIVVVLLGIVVIVIWCLIKAKNKIRNLTDKEIQHFLDGDPQPLENVGERDAHELVEALPYNKKFEIPRERLLIQRKSVLGRGSSGIVYKGSIKGVSRGVAVKTVNSDCEVKRFKGFLSELKIMIYVGKHPNIVSLVGAHTEKIKEKILYIVIELCPGGSLEGYLRNHKSSFVNQIINDEIIPEGTSTSQSGEGMMTTIDLLKWSYQVANGMEYLGMKKVIHGDVAARNILIDQNGNAKITDFGLSRRLFDYQEYVKKQHIGLELPWRYLSLECLQEFRFSTQSDVWAYGILLWEIFSIGEKPYPGLSWSVRFVQQLKNGVRMIQPDFCTNRIYELMLNCWKENPEERPLFRFITEYFKSLLGNLDREYMEMEVESQVEREYDSTFSNDGYEKAPVP